MAHVFSVSDRNTYLDVVESDTKKHLTLTIETPAETLTITVEADDLARGLLTASPSFALGVGEVAQRAILSVLQSE